MSASDKKKLRKEQAAAQLTERQRKAQAEARKTKALTITFVVIMLAIIIAAVGVFSANKINNSGIIEKNTIAATIGDRKLDTVQMNYYLIDTVQSQYSQWASMYGDSASMYLGMMGLSTSTPLNEQVINQQTGETWADSFLAQALEKAKSDYALYDKATAAGFTLSEEDESQLKLNSEQIKLYAMYYGGTNDVDKYLQGTYGPGATLKSYEEYSRISYIASSYYNKIKGELTYDENAIRTEDNKDLNKYTSYSYATYYLSSSSFLEGGTKDEKGNMSYSDEETKAALQKAYDTANSLLTAKDLTELDTAIKALEINKDNQGAASTRNDLVMYESLPASMQSWIANKERVENDITLINNDSTSTDADGNETKKTNGYYVVMFITRDENLRPLANVRHLLVAFEGGTTGSDGNKVYTEAEKGVAKTQAEKYLADWKAGEQTEDTFIAMVKEHSDDTGTKENGGLIEDIHRESNLVEYFKNWSVDADRKEGDTAVIISEYGYHVMYYVGDSETTYRDYMITEDLREADITAWHESVIKDTTAKLENTKRIKMDIILGSM